MAAVVQKIPPENQSSNSIDQTEPHPFNLTRVSISTAELNYYFSKKVWLKKL